MLAAMTDIDTVLYTMSTLKETPCKYKHILRQNIGHVISTIQRHLQKLVDYFNIHHGILRRSL